MSIDFDFACQDDCLDRMLPSNLRMLVRERDKAVKDAARILAQRDRLAELLASWRNWNHQTAIMDAEETDAMLAELDKEKQQ